jgi:hypothetical protein
VEPPLVLHLEPVGRAGVIAVVFHEAVRAEPLRQLARLCARVVEEAGGAKPWVPPGSGSPPSGAPAEVAAGVAWPTWAPPRRHPVPS